MDFCQHTAQAALTPSISRNKKKELFFNVFSSDLHYNITINNLHLIHNLFYFNLLSQT